MLNKLNNKNKMIIKLNKALSKISTFAVPRLLFHDPELRVGRVRPNMAT